jgi:hypothetical protein
MAHMKIFGLTIGKEKPLSFLEFRDMVRLMVRRKVTGAQVENRDYGFVLSVEGKPPTTCNLRTLYSEYVKSPGDKDAMVSRWLDTLVMDVPDHSWSEAQMTLRPTLKNADYLAHAHKQMQKNTPPDSLPYMPFVGEISVIVMRDLPGTMVAVTQTTLDSWGVTFEAAMQQALNNMNMMTFPVITNTLVAGTNRAGGGQEEVGLVFEGDHLTATWLVVARFRDYLAQRLEGDFVAIVPNRNRLSAIRADEPGLIAQILANNRNFAMQTHGLTIEALHVSGATTGGLVTVYKPSGQSAGKASLDPNSQFAGSRQTAPPLPPTTPRRAGPVDLSSWGGLVESTDDPSPSPAPGKGKR